MCDRRDQEKLTDHRDRSFVVIPRSDGVNSEGDKIEQIVLEYVGRHIGQIAAAEIVVQLTCTLGPLGPIGLILRIRNYFTFRFIFTLGHCYCPIIFSYLGSFSELIWEI